MVSPESYGVPGTPPELDMVSPEPRNPWCPRNPQSLMIGEPVRWSLYDDVLRSSPIVG
jgi:hypothetical protein